MTPAAYDLITIGNYTKDTIVSAAGTRHVDGGGYSYAAHAARLVGLRVAAVTHLAADDRHVAHPLTRAGVDVRVLDSEHSTHMRLEYPSTNVDERILSVAHVAAAFTPAELSDLTARAFLLTASIRGEAPLEVVDMLAEKGGLLGADVQGFVRVVGERGVLRYAPWPERDQVLARVDVLKTDAVEAEFLTGTSDIPIAAQRLAAMGPREIVLTHRDGLLVLADGRYYEAGFFPSELRGRSGRGDTCIGSYLARRLNADPATATIWAAAVTSLKMEAEGPIRRERRDVDALIARRYSGGSSHTSH